MSYLYPAIIILGGIGLLGAMALFIVGKRFRVDTDPRIEEIQELLPGANCGACGCKGCGDFAETCVKRGNLEGLNCPGATKEAMQQIATILGVVAQETIPMVAVLKCNGCVAARPQICEYDGAKSCAVINAVAAGTSGCSYGCLGCGDCTEACRFGALSIDSETQLPVIDEDKCTACGLCAKACPRNLLEMRYKGKRNMRVWVACSNRDRGAVARKVCNVACIGCTKCASACPFEAISIVDNLSYINFEKCKACRKCVAVCPTGAILTHGFPAPKPAAEPVKEAVTA